MSNLIASAVLYRERVTPKWTSFLPLSLILPTFWLTFAPINAAFGIGLGTSITLIVVALMVSNSPVIVITPEQIRVGKAALPMKYVAKEKAIEEKNAFAERGPMLDSRAYLALQSSKKGLIKIEVSDPNDPTPYWLFSTGKPELVLEAIKSARG